jgi:hypothetical protein
MKNFSGRRIINGGFGESTGLQAGELYALIALGL